jgi:hypothetical protein
VFRSAVSLVTSYHSVPEIAGHTTRSLELLRQLEAQLAERNLLLAVHNDTTLLRIPGSVQGPLRLDRKSGRGEIAGVVMLMLCYSQEALNGVVPVVSACGAPLCLFDEHSLLTQPASTRRNPLVRVFGIPSNRRCGLDVGRYLLALRHRRVCYVCTGTAHSTARLAGIRSAYELAGQGAGVISVNAVSGEERSRQAFRATFERALATGCSAWVTFNDELGFAALDFLREQGVSVPGSLIVVSFDDTPMATTHSLFG